jgi:hypothetical protein
MMMGGGKQGLADDVLRVHRVAVNGQGKRPGNADRNVDRVRRKIAGRPSRGPVLCSVLVPIAGKQHEQSKVRVA